MPQTNLAPIFTVPAPTFATEAGQLTESNRGSVPLGIGASTECLSLSLPQIEATEPTTEAASNGGTLATLPELPARLREAL